MSSITQTSKENEFEKDEALLSSPKSRRTFLKLMGASAALAGVSGCDSLRKPKQHTTF